MAEAFDKEYWERHWAEATKHTPYQSHPNPYLVETVDGLHPTTALDAGCGTGTDAIWLARQGWQVTGADISERALRTARDRALLASVTDRTEWMERDLTSWEPRSRWNLVITSYAHPSGSQSAFYQRISEWVEPGGMLLVVGHLHTRHGGALSCSTPPDAATAALSDITTRLDPAHWRIDTADERARSLSSDTAHPVLRDVVVRATRMT